MKMRIGKNKKQKLAPVPAALSLQWADLICGFEGREPLNEKFSGQISKPGIYAIIGPNGCGKSTLLKTWLGLHSPLKGSVTLDGQPISDKNHIQCGVGYVPQTHQVNKFYNISVLDFVRFGLGPKKMTPTDEENVKNQIKIWDLLPHISQSFHELSGGQKTRAIIARAFVSQPQALFLDEPLANLDLCCQQQLMETLHKQTHEKGLVVVMVDHHFGAYEKYIAEKINFARAHNSETCTISFESRGHECCSPL